MWSGLEVIEQRLVTPVAYGLVDSQSVAFGCNPCVSSGWRLISRRAAEVGRHLHQFYRTAARATKIQTYYRQHIGDIDCELQMHEAAVCVNDKVVSIKRLKGDIPKT